MLKSKQSGFTILEVLIYMGLVGLLIGGTTVAAYNLIDSQRDLNWSIADDSEAMFILAKINWALSGVSSVTSPMPNSFNSLLFVAKYDYPANPIEIYLDGTDILIEKNNNVPDILNNSSTKIYNLNFTYDLDESSLAGSITASFEINSKSYETKRLVSK